MKKMIFVLGFLTLGVSSLSSQRLLKGCLFMYEDKCGRKLDFVVFAPIDMPCDSPVVTAEVNKKIAEYDEECEKMQKDAKNKERRLTNLNTKPHEVIRYEFIRDEQVNNSSSSSVFIC